MPLQNRVTPFGDLIADPARGLFMGNRGGRIHTAGRTLGPRRFASRQWICCRLEFNGRQRAVWGDSYTELFFLDEVTALAAGHRPCFECRRAEARAFAAALAKGLHQSPPPSAGEIDDILHAERLDRRARRLHRRSLAALPDGATIAREGAAYAVRGARLLRWTPTGYVSAEPRPGRAAVDVLTPPAILAALAAGYRPQWHPSAEWVTARSPSDPPH
jgi:hypothetical protein